MPAACAVASALGFRGRVEVVGIDLGTTYSVVAVSEGRKGVRVFDDPNRGKLTASTVAFLKGGAVAVGAAAKAHAAKDPRHVLFDAKRFIGREDVISQAPVVGPLHARLFTAGEPVLQPWKMSRLNRFVHDCPAAVATTITR